MKHTKLSTGIVTIQHPKKPLFRRHRIEVLVYDAKETAKLATRGQMRMILGRFARLWHRIKVWGKKMA